MNKFEAMHNQRAVRSHLPRRFVRMVPLAVLMNSLCVAAHAQVANPASDPGEWRHLAPTVCTACHVVTLDQPDAPILRPPAPSFRVIARRPGVTEQSLRTFISTTHTTLKTPLDMPNPQLTDDQVAGVASYILSLKGSR
jgi:mono/diheme cytochrome c family protein